MKFHLESAQVFVPDHLPAAEALARTTHIAFGAHQDDLEIMSFSGILECFQQNDLWYTGVVVTNGSGSPRDDLYKDYTDADMRAVRMQEQKKAAVVGEYAAQVLLDHPSSALKDPANKGPVEDMTELIRHARPGVVFTHNLADKHDTHVAVTLRLIEAIRALAPADRPSKLLGCEVWRDLDWLCDADKVPLDVSAHENLQAALLGVFDSQICGGKRYDLATMGRRKAHATYYASHGVDEAAGLNFAMDLTPLITTHADQHPGAFLQQYVQRFTDEVQGRISKLLA